MGKADDYRNQSMEELLLTKEDLEKQLFELRNERRLSPKMEQPHRLGFVRKQIARVNTILREKELAQA